MIRVFSGGRYSIKNWLTLIEIFENGLHTVCCDDCDACKYRFACREVSQAISYCSNQVNRNLASKGG